MTTLVKRMLGAAVLDRSTYEEVEGDRLASSQAFIVVLLASAAAGLGARGFGYSGVNATVTIGVAALLGWACWALLTFEIGARLLPSPDTRADVGQLLRTLGFSAAPGILTVAAVLPGMAMPVFVIAILWMLVSMVVAVQQALDYPNPSRAVAVCLVAWALSLALVVLFGWWSGVSAG